MKKAWNLLISSCTAKMSVKSTLSSFRETPLSLAREVFKYSAKLAVLSLFSLESKLRTRELSTSRLNLETINGVKVSRKESLSANKSVSEDTRKAGEMLVDI
jgi:hypothetical protein